MSSDFVYKNLLLKKKICSHLPTQVYLAWYSEKTPIVRPYYTFTIFVTIRL